MTAGLPAMGLSGLFVLLTALALPFMRPGREAYAAMKDRRIARTFLLAALSTLLAGATWTLIEVVHRVFAAGPATANSGAPVLAVSLGVLAVVILLPEVLLLALGTRPTPTPPPIAAAPAEDQPIASAIDDRVISRMAAPSPS